MFESLGDGEEYNWWGGAALGRAITCSELFAWLGALMTRGSRTPGLVERTCGSLVCGSV